MVVDKSSGSYEVLKSFGGSKENTELKPSCVPSESP